jgi:hypothetical protein
MKIQLTIAICFISIIGFSQVNNKLDLKNGFRTYKFGDSKTKYKSNLKESISKSNDIFKYKPSEFNSIFNWEFDLMYLGFYNNKLGLISFYFYDDNTLYGDILSKLEILYGVSLNINDFNQRNDGTDDLISYNRWEGKKVIMTLRRYKHYSDPSCNDCKITLSIENKELKKQSLESEF